MGTFLATNVAVQVVTYLLHINQLFPADGSEGHSFFGSLVYWISVTTSNLAVFQNIGRQLETKQQAVSLNQISDILEGKSKLKEAGAIYFSGNFSFDHLEFLFSEVNGKPTLDVIRWRYRKHVDP